ncbi:MAG: MoaD/ThiS family protein [Bacteroidota bacterium]
MHIRVLFFGKLADISGNDLLELKNISSTGKLKAYLHGQYPGMEQIPYQMAVNKIIEKNEVIFSDGDEVALLPPFAGG